MVSPGNLLLLSDTSLTTEVYSLVSFCIHHMHLMIISTPSQVTDVSILHSSRVPLSTSARSHLQ